MLCIVWDCCNGRGGRRPARLSEVVQRHCFWYFQCYLMPLQLTPLLPHGPCMTSDVLRQAWTAWRLQGDAEAGAAVRDGRPGAQARGRLEAHPQGARLGSMGEGLLSPDGAPQRACCITILCWSMAHLTHLPFVSVTVNFVSDGCQGTFCSAGGPRPRVLPPCFSGCCAGLSAQPANPSSDLSAANTLQEYCFDSE